MTSVLDDRDEHLVLVAAGTGPEVRGWLFGIDALSTTAPSVEELDYLNTSGLVAVGDRVYRILSSPSEANASGDLLTYDTTGVVAYRRIDGLADPHGMIWDGTHLIVPCSFTNDIYRLTPAGEIADIWRAPGQGDAWHINGVHVRAGTLFASAFGVFDSHRGWAKTMGQRSGMIFEVQSLRPVVSDLACPHDPIFLDGQWLVCDSYTRRLLGVDETSGSVVRAIDLNGWTRGVAVSRDRIFVGVSGARHGIADAQRARIVILDRANWQIVGEIGLPCDEISAVALMPRRFVDGFRRGFRTNDLRVSVQDKRDLLELAGHAGNRLKMTPMQALDRRKDCRITIRATTPRRVDAGAYFDVHLRITNRGRRTLFTAAPFPIHIAVVFERIGDTAEAEIRREVLPAPIEPGATQRFTVSVQSPATPGRYRVRFTLLQEWVRWFDYDQRWFARLRSANRRYVRLLVAVQPVPLGDAAGRGRHNSEHQLPV